MLKSGFLTETLAQKITQLGAGKMKLTQTTQINNDSSGMVFILALVAIFIKGLIVYLGYNLLIPKLMYSLNVHPGKSLAEYENNFRPLNYWECVVLVILTNTLF